MGKRSPCLGENHEPKKEKPSRSTRVHRRGHVLKTKGNVGGKKASSKEKEALKEQLAKERTAYGPRKRLSWMRGRTKRESDEKVYGR